jgi:hypothetical protein
MVLRQKDLKGVNGQDLSVLKEKKPTVSLERNHQERKVSSGISLTGNVRKQDLKEVIANVKKDLKLREVINQASLRRDLSVIVSVVKRPREAREQSVKALATDRKEVSARALVEKEQNVKVLETDLKEASAKASVTDLKEANVRAKELRNQQEVKANADPVSPIKQKRKLPMAELLSNPVLKQTTIAHFTVQAAHAARIPVKNALLQVDLTARNSSILQTTVLQISKSVKLTPGNPAGMMILKRGNLAGMMLEKEARVGILQEIPKKEDLAEKMQKTGNRAEMLMTENPAETILPGNLVNTAPGKEKEKVQNMLPEKCR